MLLLRLLITCSSNVPIQHVFEVVQTQVGITSSHIDTLQVKAGIMKSDIHRTKVSTLARTVFCSLTNLEERNDRIFNL